MTPQRSASDAENRISSRSARARAKSCGTECGHLFMVCPVSFSGGCANEDVSVFGSALHLHDRQIDGNQCATYGNRSYEMCARGRHLFSVFPVKFGGGSSHSLVCPDRYPSERGVCFHLDQISAAVFATAGSVVLKSFLQG